jgi:Poly(ADP-ribose) polymerase catalytic domain
MSLDDRLTLLRSASSADALSPDKSSASRSVKVEQGARGAAQNEPIHIYSDNSSSGSDTQEFDDAGQAEPPLKRRRTVVDDDDEAIVVESKDQTDATASAVADDDPGRDAEWEAEQQRYLEGYQQRLKQEEEDAALARKLMEESDSEGAVDLIGASNGGGGGGGGGDDDDWAMAARLQAEEEDLRKAELAQQEQDDARVALHLQQQEEKSQKAAAKAAAKAAQLARRAPKRRRKQKGRPMFGGESSESESSDGDVPEPRAGLDLLQAAAAPPLALEGDAQQQQQHQQQQQQQQDSAQISIEFPTFWSPQQREHQQFKVPSDSEEYKSVTDTFLEGMPHAKVHSLTRNQNRRLWMWFLLKKKELGANNNGKANERYVFHGSRAGAYGRILSGGFDHRVSLLSGAIGAGTYFAAKSTMSDGFATGGKGAKKKMIVARVVLGCVGRGKHGLRRPPGRKGRGGLLCDSVSNSGTATGSGASMYCVFDNAQCYPEYLIEYSVGHGAGRY